MAALAVSSGKRSELLISSTKGFAWDVSRGFSCGGRAPFTGCREAAGAAKRPAVPLVAGAWLEGRGGWLDALGTRLEGIGGTPTRVFGAILLGPGWSLLWSFGWVTARPNDTPKAGKALLLLNGTFDAVRRNGQNEAIDPGGAGPCESPFACGERGSRGGHVVDEEHLAATNEAAGARPREERAGDVCDPSRAVEGGLLPRLPRAGKGPRGANGEPRRRAIRPARSADWL